MKIFAIVVSLVLVTTIFVASLIFIDSRLSAKSRMIAFEKCLANNLEIQERNRSNFSASTNLCRL